MGSKAKPSRSHAAKAKAKPKARAAPKKKPSPPPKKPAAKPVAKAPVKPAAKKAAEPPAAAAIPLRGDGRRHLLSLSFLRDGEEFTARLETDAGQITELKNRSLDQLLTLVASELEDLLE